MTMEGNLDSSAVEKWLDANQDWYQEYVIKKLDIKIVNKWLTDNGYCSIVSKMLSPLTPNRKDSKSCPASPFTTDTKNDEVFFPETDNNNSNSRNWVRSNSKKFLRQNFAKSKNRGMFRTYQPSCSSGSESDTQVRRSSLKEMKMFRSLPPTSLSMLSMLIRSKVRLPRRTSRDTEIKRQLRSANEREFFMEIVQDIANELDLKALYEKILSNIKILLEAEYSSLFLVEGAKGRQRLVSKVFDIHSRSNLLPTSEGDNVAHIPWGSDTIIGFVAETKQSINIENATQDDRFNGGTDRIMGYSISSLLCMPIKNAEDELIGVAQVINKNESEGYFTSGDEKLLETYLTFCGIALGNAQIFEAYSKEYERNKVLLEVVHDLFEEQRTLDNMVFKIMQKSHELLKCHRCSVFLRDMGTEDIVFNQVFDLVIPTKNGHSKISPDNCSDLRMGNTVAEIVASTGETISIPDAYKDSRFDPKIDKAAGFCTHSILAKPVISNLKIIGVLQVVNRTDGLPFDDNDDSLFEAYSIFCALGINNCMLYDEVTKAVAKQAVALETLSYHANAANEDAVKMSALEVPDAHKWRLEQLSFNDFSLDTDEMVLASIRLFKDTKLIKKFKINYETLCRFLLTVKKNYRKVAYHNWRHAFNVCQMMFAAMEKSKLKKYLSDTECLVLIVACICHDLDHRGTNNAFQIKTSSALAQLYGTKATLENHHFNHAVMILNSEGHNIFSNLSSDEYSQVINLLKHSILATDLSLHFQVRTKFFELVDSKLYSWDDSEQREMLRSVLMTACDIAAVTKPWEVQRKVADLLLTEFFDQGDKERNELKIQPQALMDREKQDELPKLQMGWIDGVCIPLYRSLAKLDKVFQPMFDGVLANRTQWQILDENRLSQLASQSTI